MNIKKILTALGMIGLLTAGAVRAQAPEAAQVQQDSLIAVDTVLKDGIRFIQSRDFDIYKGWTTGAAFNLSYADRPGDTTPYRLNITFAEGQFTMAAGTTKLMLKLKKAKIVMELINTRNIGPSDYRSELTKDGTYYYITPSFAISETQIQQIAADKVVKMRLIHDKGKFDREIQNNAAAVGFKAAYEAIRQRLEAETSAKPAAPAIENKPVPEEESYGYIVDEEDKTYVAEEDGVEAIAGETMVETVEEAVEAPESVEAVTAETEVETMEKETETAEAVETVETEVEAVEEAAESAEAAETVETEVEAVEEAAESAEAAETEEPAAETIVEESETPESTETTETVTDNTETETETEAEPEPDSVETAIETEN